MIIFIFSKSAYIFSSERTTAGTVVVIIFIVDCWLYFWLIDEFISCMIYKMLENG